MMRHLAILGIERIAVVYFDNEFGRDGNDRARGMAKAYDSVKLSSVPLRPGPAGVEEAAQKLRTASPQATILYSPVGPAVQLVNRFRHLGGRTTFYGLSVISGDALLAGLGAGASDFVVAQVMPSGTKQGWALVQDCRNALKQSGLEYRGAGQLEGCVIGAVTVEAIRRCGTDVSGRSIARALESKPISLGDFELRFSPSNHNGSQLVDLGLVTREGKITR